MKVILCMAITVNGYIATDKGKVHWVSEKSWEGYLDMARKVGCVIVGRRTYDVMQGGEFQEGCTYVVMTRSRPAAKRPGVIFTGMDPKDVLKVLEGKGVKKVLLCGGGETNSLFMREGLIDEAYLDMEPTLLGKGIRLFSEGDFEADLELMGIKRLSENGIQLHYRVRK